MPEGLEAWTLKPTSQDGGLNEEVTSKNVYIATYTDKMELKQERWVSRSLNICMTKTGPESVLVDLTNKIMSVKQFSTSPVEKSKLSNEMATATTNMMAGFLGLVPFADVSVIPDDVEWKWGGGAV